MKAKREAKGIRSTEKIFVQIGVLGLGPCIRILRDELKDLLQTPQAASAKAEYHSNQRVGLLADSLEFNREPLECVGGWKAPELLHMYSKST